MHLGQSARARNRATGPRAPTQGGDATRHPHCRFYGAAGRAIVPALGFDQATVLAEGSWPALHTLAALYAESGKSLEARTELLKCMDLAGHEEPSSVDWYVLGRIAENYGAAETAIADYKRVDKPQRLTPGSTYELAQKRLVALKK